MIERKKHQSISFQDSRKHVYRSVQFQLTNTRAVIISVRGNNLQGIDTNWRSSAAGSKYALQSMHEKKSLCLREDPAFNRLSLNFQRKKIFVNAIIPSFFLRKALAPNSQETMNKANELKSLLRVEPSLHMPFDSNIPKILMLTVEKHDCTLQVICR